ncbi:MAG: Gldg family protein [Kofleriaceae bacterium]
MIWTVAKKELRGYFNSAVAVLFLTAFLIVTFYTFYWREKFFARGLADLRPLFEWMPGLLIILASALSMRLWADERRAGTLEVLLTLPVPRWKLVLGKFVAGLLLIALALGLTLGLPIAVSQLGNLDGGPVFAGYLASLLLAAAYLSIGMCVSAATDNQIVAFVGTALICAAAWAIGDDQGALGRFLGTGVRFESVARGVLDLRDLAYYGAIVVIGVAINVLLLHKLSWGRGAKTRRRRTGVVVAVALIVANAIAFCLWLAPIGRARLDLTEGGSFSLSPVTERLLAGLDEKLTIRGYFSERTHPKLAPLIPQIRDLLEEYRVAGGSKIRVEMIDPTDSEEAKRDAKERFALESTPLPFATADEQSVVNAYFAIGIEYGDQHEVIGRNPMELLEVRPNGAGNDIDVTLRNLEYQLTRAIKKAASEFSSVDALFASTPGKLALTAYITPKSLPENWKDGPTKLTKVVEEMTKQSGGKLTFTTVEPTSDAQIRELFGTYGLRPYLDPIANQVYYFHLILQVGERIVRIVPPQNLGEADLKNAITEGLKRASPGFTRVVGLWTPPAGAPMQLMETMPPQQMPPPQAFEALRQELARTYEVRPVDLNTPVADDVDTLILAGPANLDPSAAERVDQFVMRGGSLIVLAGRYRLMPGPQALAVEKVTTGLESMLQKWGVTLGDELVMDPNSERLPVPQPGNGVRFAAYLPFVKMTGDQLTGGLITSGLPGSVLHWAATVNADEKAGDDVHRVEPLLRSSGDSWLTSSTTVEPDFQRYGELGFPGPAADLPADKRGKQVLAAAITGGFTSAFAKPKSDAPKDPGSQASPNPLIEHSPPDTRVVVFGSSAFASDDIIGLGQQLRSDLTKANLQLIQNAVDWSLADTDLLEIRGRTAGAHAITLPPEARGPWRTVSIVLAFLGLIAVVGISVYRRRAVAPIVEGKQA